MSEANLLSDFVKALPSITDNSGKSVMVSDAQGELAKITGFNLVGVSVGSVAGSFASVLYPLGFYHCVVYSQSNRFIHCVFDVVHVKYDASDNRAPHYVLASSGGLSVNVINSYGSISFKMTNGEALPSDLKLSWLRISL